MNEKILVLLAREDFEMALNLIVLIRTEEISLELDDNLLAYAMAKDWVRWIENPTAPDCPQMAKDMNLAPVKELFQHFIEQVERVLKKMDLPLAMLFTTFDSNWKNWAKANNKGVAELAKAHLHAFNTVAEFFYQIGQPCFKDILEEKGLLEDDDKEANDEEAQNDADGEAK